MTPSNQSFQATYSTIQMSPNRMDIRGKRSLVRALRVRDGKEIANKVAQDCDELEDSNHDRHGSIEREQISDKAGKEDGKRQVHHHGQDTNDSGDVVLLQSGVSELTDTTAVTGAS